jgi:PAS domain S-box-containing protein
LVFSSRDARERKLIWCGSGADALSADPERDADRSGGRSAEAVEGLASLSGGYESPYAALLKNMREEEYLQLLDLTPLFVTVLGPRRERLYINQVGLDYLGTTTERWRETLPSAELHPEDLEPVQHYWNNAFQTGLPFECEFRSRRYDGKYRWLLGRVNKVVGDEGEVRRWHLAVTDIEDRKRDEEALRHEKPSILVEVGLESIRLKRVLDYVSENFRGDITLQKLADIAGYSPFHFARKFTLTVGIPPQRYLARMRLDNAMLELAAGQLSLAEVAFNARFSSQASFTRAFHRFAGTTPKQYQRCIHRR